MTTRRAALRADITLYECANGTFAPAYALSPEEAVSALNRGWLLAEDMRRLGDAARAAVVDEIARRSGFEIAVREHAMVGVRRGESRVVGVRETGL